MTEKVRVLKEQVTIIDNIVDTIGEYLDGDAFEQLCDELATSRTLLITIVKKIEEEENKPRELGTTWRTAFNPVELTNVARTDLTHNFPFSMIEDTIRFKVSILVTASKDNEISKHLHLSTKHLINNLNNLNYDYLEF